MKSRLPAYSVFIIPHLYEFFYHFDYPKTPAPYSVRQTGIYLSAAISTALHGEPSAPDRFNGAAFKK